MTPSSNVENRVRLRILEIGLQPPKSKRAIKAELLIDGKVANVLPTIEGGQPLRWNKLIICDTYTSSRVELVLYERQLRIYSRYSSESCLVSEMMEISISTKILKVSDLQYHAEFKVLNQAQAEGSFAKSREKLEEIEGMSTTPERLRSAQRMFKSMLEFGGAVAELNPIAKTVLAVCTRAWERVEEQQKSGEELDDLAGRLIGMAPLVDEVKKHAQLEPLRQNIEDFLYLIEDVSMFVLERSTKGFVGASEVLPHLIVTERATELVRVLKSVVDSSDRDRVDELGKRFERISSDFERGIGVQTMSTVTTSHEAELLKRLNPVEPSGHDPSKACQEGTRLKVLSDIDDWIQDPNPSSTFMWIYGQAGIGKSAISASVCNRLSDRGTPIVSFFCKRDDPSLRDPLRLINSITHGLAWRYPAYGKLVAKAIGTNPELCTSHLGVRYEGLLKRPLSDFNNSPLLPVQIILVDAMDECGSDETRRQLLGCFRDLSLLVPWIRFIVTSRPNSDISNFFDKFDISPVSRCNLKSYPTANDIRAYIQVKVGDIAIRDEWPAEGIERLCAKAEELFIWAATACKFVADAIDSQERLKQLTGETTSIRGFSGIDSLYSAVIRNSITDQDTDNILILRRCIGAIVAISMKQPVPIEVLCELMREQMRPAVLREVVARLGAVLYSDAQLKGAIRDSTPRLLTMPWTSVVLRNAELSIGCMSTLMRELRFNICELETSHLPNREIPDLNARIDVNITGQLAYSCIYWINHLMEGNDKEVAAQVAEVIDGPRLLYWIEILSVLERVEVAVQGLRELTDWLKSRQHDLADYVWDAYRFVFAFSDPIITSAPHIYLSALPFSPRQSGVSRRLLPLFPNTACVVEGGDETWPKWLRSVSLPTALQFMSASRDSQLFITSCCNRDESGQISVFDIWTGGLVKTIEHSSSHLPKLVAISPDGTLIASVSRTAEMLLWETNTGAMIHKFQAEGSEWKVVEACSFSPNAAALRMLIRIIGDSGNTTIISETGPKGTINTPLPHLNNTGISAVAFSSDGACLALGYYDNQAVSIITSWYDPIERTELRFDFDGYPYQIIFSPNGTLIAVALLARSVSRAVVRIWDVKKGAYLRQIYTGHNRLQSFAFSPDGTQIITAHSEPVYEVQVFNLQTDGRSFGQSIKGSADISLVAFSPDGAYILCGSRASTTTPSQISIWDASQVNVKKKTPKKAYTLEHQYGGHPEHILSVLFSPNGTRIISGSTYGTLQIQDSRTRIPIGESLHVDSALELITISSDGSRIIALTDKSTLHVWDASTGSLLFIKLYITSFALSPNGNHLITGIHNHENDSIMAAWDANTGDIIRNIGHAQSSPQFIAFSQDRSRLFSHHQIPILGSSSSVISDNTTGYRNEVCVWDSTSYELVGSWSMNLDQYNVEQSWKQPRVHALSPNGDLIVSSYNSTILIHNAYTGRATTEPLVGHKGDVTCIAVSPDGALMASCAGFDPIMLWDPKSGVALGYLFTGSIYAYSVAFSSDRTKLVSGLGDSIFMWDITTHGGRNPWSNDDPSEWPSDTHCFPPHPTHHGWVSHDQKSLTFWLPYHYRRPYDPRFLYSISPSAIHVDFSRFGHGAAWTSVISKEALTYYDRTGA